MPQLEYQGEKIEVDSRGYLRDYDSWNENVARALARDEGIAELTDDELEVIRFMRQYYGKYKSFPLLRLVCRNVHQTQDCVNEEFIDPLKAWKIAGLPEPVGEVLSYLTRE